MSASAITSHLPHEDWKSMGLELAQIGVTTVDYLADTVIPDPIAAEIFGLTPHQAVSRAEFHARIHPDDLPMVLAEVDKLIDPNFADKIEVIHRTIAADGTLRWVHARKKLYRNSKLDGQVPVTGVAAILDITEPRRLEAEREAALERARQLHVELNHRVMNSMSMVGSVISLEARNFDDTEATAAFARVRARVSAIGSLYKQLLSADSAETVEAQTYLPPIVNSLVASSEQSENISLNMDIGAMPLSSRVAVPLGLIANELITNSLKYAYKDRTGGKMSVSLTHSDHSIELSISDDGPGIDPEARVDSGLGQKLTSAFAAQLNGTLTMTSSHEGTRHVLVFPRTAEFSGTV